MVKNTFYNKNDYVFSPTLKEFLVDWLQYFEDEKKLDDIKNAEGKISKAKWEDLSKEKIELDKTKRLLQRRKVDILDKHIFLSMANLIVFFDNLAEHPELRNIFEEDVKELLGFIGPNAKKYEDNIVTRLLQSILKWDTNKDQINFRLELMSSIQNVLYHKITYLTLMDENLGDSVTNTIVSPDVGRALIWCRMFSAKYRQSEKKIKDQSREPNRPINF